MKNISIFLFFVSAISAMDLTTSYASIGLAGFIGCSLHHYKEYRSALLKAANTKMVWDSFTNEMATLKQDLKSAQLDEHPDLNRQIQEHKKNFSKQYEHANAQTRKHKTLMIYTAIMSGVCGAALVTQLINHYLYPAEAEE